MELTVIFTKSAAKADEKIPEKCLIKLSPEKMAALDFIYTSL